MSAATFLARTRHQASLQSRCSEVDFENTWRWAPEQLAVPRPIRHKLLPCVNITPRFYQFQPERQKQTVVAACVCWLCDCRAHACRPSLWDHGDDRRTSADQRPHSLNNLLYKQMQTGSFFSVIDRNNCTWFEVRGHLPVLDVSKLLSKSCCGGSSSFNCLVIKQVQCFFSTLFFFLSLKGEAYM